jgi:hypothetical protein
MRRNKKGQFVKTTKKPPRKKPVKKKPVKVVLEGALESDELREFAVILTVGAHEAAQFPGAWGSDALKKKMEETLERARIALQEYVENETGLDFNSDGTLSESHVWEPLHSHGIHGVAWRMVWRPEGWVGDDGLPPFSELLKKAEQVKMEDLPQ